MIYNSDRELIKLFGEDLTLTSRSDNQVVENTINNLKAPQLLKDMLVYNLYDCLSCVELVKKIYLNILPKSIEII